MSFREEKVSEFLEIFHKSKNIISQFDGCKSLTLLKDIHSENTFFTYSTWESEEHLNAYRNSAIFKVIWKNTKVLFSENAQAWSTSACN